MAGSAPNYDNVQWPGSGGLRVPQEAAPASLAVTKLSNVDIGTQGSSNIVTLLPSQGQASELVITNSVTSTSSAVVNLAAAIPGHVFVVYNNTASGCTVKVIGQTGISVGSGKRAILVCESVDIARAAADV